VPSVVNRASKPKTRRDIDWVRLARVEYERVVLGLSSRK